MALVTCPKCKKTVSNTSQKCPNCGAALSCSVFDKNAPKHAKYHLASNVLLAISFVLIMLDLFAGAKTYVGGILFGVGFMFQSLSLMEKEKDEDYDDKKRGRILFWVSIAFILGGIFYLYMDLR